MIRAAAEGSEGDRAHVLEALEPQVRLMVTARLSPTPNQLHAVEDITQEVLAALASGLPRLVNRTVDGLNAYASGIVARQVALSIRRRASRKAQRQAVASLDSTVAALSGAGPLWQFLSCGGTSPASAAQRSEQAAKLMSELGRLKREYREVITLAFFDQLTVSEIARQMDMTRPAASMLLLRAVRALRRNMTGSSRIGQSDARR